jgi:hypothetical protein
MLLLREEAVCRDKMALGDELNEEEIEASCLEEELIIK